MSIDANLSVGYSARAFVDCITQGFLVDKKLNESDLLAIEMYCSSFFENTINAKFLSLMISIESMLEFINHNEQIQNVIQQAINNITALEIHQTEKESLIGSLNHLKKISITKAGILLAEKYLGHENNYLGLTPADFFKKCYNLRSLLVHYGKRNKNNFSIEKVTPELIKFTGTLIERKLLS